MATYKTPGIYVDEINHLPHSISSIPTAIPAFIGYTQKAQLLLADDLKFIPKKISSLKDYEHYFGLPMFETGISVALDTSLPANIKAIVKIENPAPYLMHYNLQLYFANGGGPCYIASTGGYNANPEILGNHLEIGLEAIANVKEPTLLLFPDAIHLSSADQYYQLYNKAMLQCALLKNRFTIMDVWMDNHSNTDPIALLREYAFAPLDILKYAAAYYPALRALINYAYQDELVTIVATNDSSINGTLAQLKLSDINLYNLVINVLNKETMILPASCAVAGVYVQVDNARGVWKAPANINIVAAQKPTLAITAREQESLNVDTATGRSINAIRSFAGRGAAFIWGARTLMGNDNEWRYVSVRRFFNTVKTSVKYGLEHLVFEPNDTNTWTRAKTMTENYLYLLWKDGALAGNKPTEAFFVNTGIGQTMTTQDILEGRMIIEIGMAVVRPAEFIIIRIEQKMKSK